MKLRLSPQIYTSRVALLLLPLLICGCIHRVVCLVVVVLTVITRSSAAVPLPTIVIHPLLTALYRVEGSSPLITAVPRPIIYSSRSVPLAYNCDNYSLLSGLESRCGDSLLASSSTCLPVICVHCLDSILTAKR